MGFEIIISVLLIIGGYTSIPKLDKQFFPTPEVNQIEIRMEFRGASPREVEEQIAVRIEEAIQVDFPEALVTIHVEPEHKAKKSGIVVPDEPGQ